MKIATALLALASFGAAAGFAGQANPPASGTDQTQTGTTKTKTKKHHKKAKKGSTADTGAASTTNK